MFGASNRTKTSLTAYCSSFINAYMNTDDRLIKRCIELARQAYQEGDSPFGALVADGDDIIVEATNSITINNDITAHAEIIAIRKTQKIVGHSDLSHYVLYSSCEPCPMCAFMIREAKFHKVVFSLRSPSMGGHSKWKILTDAQLQYDTPYFSQIPEIKSGLRESDMIKFYDSIGWDSFYKPVHC